jgi:hypothetical protein
MIDVGLKKKLLFNCFIHRPEDFGDAALLVDRREVELKAGETAPVGARRERTGGCSDRVLKEPLREAEKRQEFGQQPVALGRKHINVARHHRVELRHRHLTLIRPAFAEQHLPRSAASRESRAVRHIAPRPNVQRPRLKMFQPDEPLQPGFNRITRLIEILHHIPKPHPLPALALKQRQPGPVGVGVELGEVAAATAGALAGAGVVGDAAAPAAVAAVAAGVVVAVVVALVFIIMLTMVTMVIGAVVMTQVVFVNRTIRWNSRSIIGRLFLGFIGRFQGFVGRLSVDSKADVRNT